MRQFQWKLLALIITYIIIEIIWQKAQQNFELQALTGDG